MTNVKMHIIAAVTHGGGIGNAGGIPWSIPEDMKFFQYITRTVENASVVNAVIMGRKTYESLPAKVRPLPGRLNVVVSTTLGDRKKLPEGPLCLEELVVVESFESALEVVKDKAHQLEQIFVAGGVRIYEAALQSPYLSSIYLTRVQGEDIVCDTHCPGLAEVVDAHWKKNEGAAEKRNNGDPFVPVFVSQTRGYKEWTYDFVLLQRLRTLDKKVPSFMIRDDGNSSSICGRTCQRRLSQFITGLRADNSAESSVAGHTPPSWNQPVVCCPFITGRHHEEFQYLDLIASIISEGAYQMDRTGVGTLTKFGVQLRFNLARSFPLLTTKSVFWKGVVEELLWFIRGSTNSNELSKNGVKIWDSNGSRAFLDALGFHDRDSGDLGPIYGFQWRHFGAQYTNMHADYAGQGIDQLQRVVDRLRKCPQDRRIIMSAWNPVDLDRMALPPCHLLCQFYVEHGRLSCIMYQRSADMGLGVPFNIASYSLLTRMLAQVCGLMPGEFVHVLGNAHVYMNHIEPLKVQMQRCPRPFPSLVLDPSVTEIDNFRSESFSLRGYCPMPKITMELAV